MSNNVHLLRLLAQNEIDQLFVLLRENAEAEIALLEAQWQALKADERAGVLTQEQINIEEARIRRSLLEYIDKQARPVETPPAPKKGLSWLLPVALGGLAVGILIVFLIRPWGPGGTTKPPTPPDTTSPSAQSAAAGHSPKQLAIPPDPIELTAQYVGTTGYQFLSAELSDRNPEHYLLKIHLRCIRPPYGQNVSPSTLHLLHGAEELAPFEVNFPFVNPNTTQDGVLQFEVPKTWADATLVIYHGAVEPYQKAKIPLKF